MLQIVDPQLLAWRTQTLYACPHIFCASEEEEEDEEREEVGEERGDDT